MHPREKPQAKGLTWPAPHKGCPIAPVKPVASRVWAQRTATALVLAGSGLAQAQTQIQAQTQPQPLPVSATACPVSFVTRADTSAESLKASLRQAQALASVCDTRPDYHAHLGALLMQDGQNQQAANALEKALLLDSDQPGAQLDYAQALAVLGEKASAQQLINQVIQRPDIDPGLRQWLQSAWAGEAVPGRAWTWSQMLQSTVGHESNLSSATHANAITLYLSNGPVLVPLDDTAKPQSGLGMKQLLALQGQSPAGMPDLRLSLALQTRHTNKVQDHHLLAVTTTYVKPMGLGQLHLRWDGHHFHQRNSSTTQEQGPTIQYHFVSTPIPCRWRVGLGSMSQEFQGNSVLDGRTHSARLEASCKHAQAAETHWGLSTAQDRANDPQRPGGDKTRYDWSVRHERTVGQAATHAWFKQTHTQDSERFSPLTGDLVSRSIRTDWGVGVWWPMGGRWSVGLDVESTSQKSSNALLNIKNLSAYAGVRWMAP